MSFKMKPVLRGEVRGLVATQAAVVEMIHRKPILTFTLTGQVVVDEKGKFLSGGDETTGKVVDVPVDFHFRIDPSKLTSNLQNSIQAVRDRISAAQRIMEKMAQASGVMGDVKSAKVSREDLPDADLLSELYDELDEAMDERLLALFVKDEDGFHWDYVDANGHTPSLSANWLKDNVHVAEQMQAALANFLNPTSTSRQAATKTNTTNGTSETMPPIQQVSSQDLPSLSLAPDPSLTAKAISENETTPEA